MFAKVVFKNKITICINVVRISNSMAFVDKFRFLFLITDLDSQMVNYSYDERLVWNQSKNNHVSYELIDIHISFIVGPVTEN